MTLVNKIVDAAGNTTFVAVEKCEWDELQKKQRELRRSYNAALKKNQALNEELLKTKSYTVSHKKLLRDREQFLEENQNLRDRLLKAKTEVNNLNKKLIDKDKYLRENQKLKRLLDGKGLRADTPLPLELLHQIDAGSISPLEAVIIHRKLNKNTLCKNANIARSTLYRAFSEPNKSLVSVYQKISKTLGCSLDLIVTGRTNIQEE